MCEGALSHADLERLVGEIAAHAHVQEILLKRSATQMIDAGEQAPLGAIPGLIASGMVRAAQVRYVWEGTTWMDTILATPGGCRVVRIQHL